MKVFWGDMHANIHTYHLKELDRIFLYAREILDFFPIAYYPQEFRVVKGFRYEDWLDEEIIKRDWKTICDFVARYNQPGDFITFAGYEWQGDGRYGDHNVFYFDDYPPLIKVNTLPELYAEIRRRKLRALVIPHHTAYQVGIRGKNWDIYDEELSPFAEIYSQHGSSETDEGGMGLRRNQAMGPEVSGGTVEEALSRGYRIGIIASTDNHTGTPGFYGHGLMACYASSLTREALWEAFKERRVYGVTGDRVVLDFRVEEGMMGEVVSKRGSIGIKVKVRGCEAIDYIEILRNNRLIECYHHEGKWEIPEDDERMHFKLRMEGGWGPKDNSLSPQDIQGSIKVREGSILKVEKCWRNVGQWVRRINDSEYEFNFRIYPSNSSGEIPVEALIFEMEGSPSTLIKIEIEGRKLSFTLKEAMRKSQVVFFPEKVKTQIRERYNIDIDSLPRDDPFYFLSHKVKIHRAVPEVGYTVEINFRDPNPPPGVNFYRVRVHQRNGQKAWSSPIWVKNE